MSSECFDALRLLYSTDSSFTAEEREPYMKRCQQPRVQNPETKEKLQTQDFLNTRGVGAESITSDRSDCWCKCCLGMSLKRPPFSGGTGFTVAV